MAQSFREIIGVSPSQASIKDSVLLIIDAQNEYKTGPLKTSNITSTSSTITTLLERYRAAHAPVIHIKHSAPVNAPVFRQDDTRHSEIFDSLTPTNEEPVVQKNFPGSFTETSLEEEIKGTGRKQVVLVGYMAHVCVSTTARQAAERGYDVVVVEDAVGDRDIPGVKAEDLVRVVLRELEDAFATVVKAEDIK